MGKKKKLPLKMEILKAGGKPDRILMKNVVYEIDQLEMNVANMKIITQRKKNRPYTTLFYKQSPIWRRSYLIFRIMPIILGKRGKLSLLPKQNHLRCCLQCKSLELESVVCKSVWKDKNTTCSLQ